MTQQRAAPPALTLALTIVGDPVPKGRPRFNTKTGRAYTPEATRVAENDVGWRMLQAFPGLEPDGEHKWSVSLVFDYRRDGDIDNFQKLILDALNGVIWKDDRQVTEIMASKHCLGRDLGEPCTEILLQQLERLR